MDLLFVTIYRLHSFCSFERGAEHQYAQMFKNMRNISNSRRITANSIFELVGNYTIKLLIGSCGNGFIIFDFNKTSYYYDILNLTNKLPSNI